MTAATLTELPRIGRPEWMQKMAAVGVPLMVLGGIIGFVTYGNVVDESCCFGEAEPFLLLGGLVLVVGFGLVLACILRLGEERGARKVVAAVVGWPMVAVGVGVGIFGVFAISMVEEDDILGDFAAGILGVFFLLPAFVATLIGGILVLNSMVRDIPAPPAPREANADAKQSDAE